MSRFISRIPDESIRITIRFTAPEMPILIPEFMSRIPAGSIRITGSEMATLRMGVVAAGRGAGKGFLVQIQYLGNQRIGRDVPFQDNHLIDEQGTPILEPADHRPRAWKITKSSATLQY